MVCLGISRQVPEMPYIQLGLRRGEESLDDRKALGVARATQPKERLAAEVHRQIEARDVDVRHDGLAARIR